MPIVCARLRASTAIVVRTSSFLILGLLAACAAEVIDEGEVAEAVDELAPNQREVFAAADTFVRSGSYASTSYASATHLYVDQDLNGSTQIIYVRFVIPAVGTIASAKLRFYVGYDGSAAGADVKGVSNTDFAENITWNTRPVIDGPSYGPLSSGTPWTWSERDVTAAVKSGQAVAFAVVARSADGMWVYAKEANQNVPRLLLTLGSASTPTSTTTFTPTPSTTATLDGVAVIPSNFDVDAELIPVGIPADAGTDPVGAFRFSCRPSHLSYDDPIVYPGQPGKAHLHEFFGNTLANAYSTYATLRTTGMGTCQSPVNRSAYWMPAMMNGKGKVVRPDSMLIYYKRFPETSPECTTRAKACVPLPRGLRYVFGYNGADATAFDKADAYYTCKGTGAIAGNYPDIPTAAPNCPVGAQLGALLKAPSCWNGTELDSADHRSHLAYQVRNSQTGQMKCPDTHPYIIPGFTLHAWYTTDADLDRSGAWSSSVPTWHLSSDEHDGMVHAKPGSTLHADWFGAWDSTVQQKWTDHCIDNHLNCSSGTLGNGQQIKVTYVPPPFVRIVDSPPMP
jgi:hypothetical protein